MWESPVNRGGYDTRFSNDALMPARGQMQEKSGLHMSSRAGASYWLASTCCNSSDVGPDSKTLHPFLRRRSGGANRIVSTQSMNAMLAGMSSVAALPSCTCTANSS